MFLDLLPLACTLILAPGVNSVLLFCSGAQFGVWPSVPHIVGSVLAFLFILVGASVGISGGVAAHAGVRMGLSMFGGFFVIYLGVKLFFTAPLDFTGSTTARPMGAGQAIILMLLNPGAYVLALTAVAIASGTDAPYFSWMAMLLVMFASAGCVATFGWTLAGVVVRRVIHQPKPVQVLNRFFGLVIVLSGVSILLQ
ncbi:MAG: LysE family translocator [Halocynthiibacter sp.]